VKGSLRSLGPEVTASRMLRDYVLDIYEPMAERATRLAGDGFARARALASWKDRVRAAWPEVRIDSVAMDDATADLGAERVVTASVHLGALGVDDVEVQLLHGPVGPEGDLLSTTTVVMAMTDGNAFSGTLSCDAAGRYGYTVRVVPAHVDLVSFAELGEVTSV
jgi:starch phosphorylase